MTGDVTNVDAGYLLIDDDPMFTQVLAKALRRRGLLAYQAQCADEAFTQLRDQDIAYATLDLKMGEESGLQLIPQLLEVNSALKIVVLTGYSSIATAVEAIKKGAFDYLCKPADADEILAALMQEKPMESVASIAEEPPSVSRLEWEHIQRVLAEHEGNISATARALGMHRRTLQRKLQKRPVKR